MTATALVRYWMEDVSKEDYGAALHIHSNLHFRYEQWTVLK